MRASSVKKALDKLEGLLGAPMFSRIFRFITFDNGAGFSDVRGMESPRLPQGKRMNLRYAHPRGSSERETNENHNGIIRRFFPKGTGSAKVGRPRIREVARWMSTCPRRILGGETQDEAFAREFDAGRKTLNKLGVACL